MIFPFESLSGIDREIGLVVGVLIGFFFGFVLERAGFGRSTTLAGQFYFHDMTVFKVMFTAIVTAMLGVVVVDGLGLADFGHIASMVVSGTFLWPMIFGGLLLGAGFIISGYCPGTSLVAAASGNLDGMLAFGGVIIGSVLFGEMYPLVSQFYLSGDMGQVFLYEMLGVPPAVVAMGIAAGAVGCFLGAEVVEKIATRMLLHREPVVAAPQSRRLAIAIFGLASVAGLTLLFVPVDTGQAQTETTPTARAIDIQSFAHRVLEEPWKLQIIDLRSADAFLEQRIPGSENCEIDALDILGLQYSRGIKDLVLVGTGGSDTMAVPEAALAYPGAVFVLSGGWDAWEQFALTAPATPSPEASVAELDTYRFHAAVHSAMTGVKAPPPPKTTTKFVAPPKRKAGGCS